MSKSGSDTNATTYSNGESTMKKSEISKHWARHIEREFANCDVVPTAKVNAFFARFGHPTPLAHHGEMYGVAYTRMYNTGFRKLPNGDFVRANVHQLGEKPSVTPGKVQSALRFVRPLTEAEYAAEQIGKEPVEGPNWSSPTALVFRSTSIRQRGEMLSLTDMWKAAGSDEMKRPSRWLDQDGTSEFINCIAAMHNVAQDDIIDSDRGRNGGTWAHWQIAMAYAKYLSPEFHAWCNEVVRAHMTGQPAPAARPAQAPTVDPTILSCLMQTANALTVGMQAQAETLERQFEIVERQTEFLAQLSKTQLECVERLNRLESRPTVERTESSSSPLPQPWNVYVYGRPPVGTATVDDYTRGKRRVNKKEVGRFAKQICEERRLHAYETIAPGARYRVRYWPIEVLREAYSRVLGVQ